MIELLESVKPDFTSEQYLLSSISQCSAAILALILTIKMVMSQVGKYRLPLAYIANFAANELLVLTVYLITISFPLAILAFKTYQYSIHAFLIFIVSILSIFYYTSLLLNKNAVTTFLQHCIENKKTQFEDAIYDICLQAMSHHDISVYKKSIITLTFVPKQGLCWSTINNYINRIAAKSLDNNEQFQAFLESLYVYTSPIARSNIHVNRSKLSSLLFRIKLTYEVTANRPITSNIVTRNRFFRGDSLNSTHETYRILLKHRFPDMQYKVYETFFNSFYDHFVASKLIKENIEEKWEPTINTIDLMIYKEWIGVIPLETIVKFLKDKNLYSGTPIIMYENWVPKKAKDIMQHREQLYKKARGNAWNDFIDFIKPIRSRDPRYQKEFEIQVYDQAEGKYIVSKVLL